MSSSGTAYLNFGAYPGASDASVVVTGQTGIIPTSLVEVWINPLVSDDHTADEHRIETIKVSYGDIVSGTGFTIYGYNTSQLNEPLVPPRTGSSIPSIGGVGTRIYGVFNVAWVWV